MARNLDTLQAKLVFAGALVTTIGGIAVAWIQFGPGFGPRPNEEGTFHGYIRDENGGVPRAEVKWHIGEPPQTKFTDDQGLFAVTAPKDRPSARLEVTARGYKPVDRTVLFDPKNAYLIELERSLPQPASRQTQPSPASLADDPNTRKESSQSDFALTGDVITKTTAEPPRNYFLDSKSPKMWFDEAKYYRRTDKDSPTEKLEKETPQLAFVRRYFSADSGKVSPIGLGWHHPYESHIDIEKSTLTKIVFRGEYQRITEFQLMHDVALAISELKPFFPAASKDTRLLDLLKADEQAGDSYFLPSVKKMKYMGVNMEGGAQLSFQREFMVIRFVDNTVYLFDHQGRMRQIVAPNESRLELRYDPVRQDRLARITTTSGAAHFMDLGYGDNGMITSVTYDDKTVFSYTYDQQKRLTAVKTPKAELYRYVYDAKGRMTSVQSGTEEQKLEIRYNDVGWRVYMRRGEKTLEWTINDSPEIPRITTKRSEGVYSEVTDYSFEESTQTLTMTKEGESAVTYHLTQCGCKPLDITRDGRTTYFVYDELGRLVKQESPARVLSYTYDIRSGKVASVTERDVSNQTESNVALTYDPHGNLTKVDKNDGKSVQLAYDPDNRIASLEDSGHTKIAFTYNDRGKPTVIHVKGVGTINVAYNPGSNDIEKVEHKAEGAASDSGNDQKIAIAVTSTFQELLDLINAAKTEIDTEYSHVRDTI